MLNCEGQFFKLDKIKNSNFGLIRPSLDQNYVFSVNYTDYINPTSNESEDCKITGLNIYYYVPARINGKWGSKPVEYASKHYY